MIVVFIWLLVMFVVVFDLFSVLLVWFRFVFLCALVGFVVVCFDFCFLVIYCVCYDCYLTFADAVS